MPCHAHRITHVVQAIKKSNDVKVLAGVADCIAHFKLGIRNSRGGGSLASNADGFAVVVVTHEG